MNHSSNQSLKKQEELAKKGHPNPEDEPIIILESKVWRRGIFRNNGFVLLIGIVIGAGLLALGWSILGEKSGEEQVLITNVFLRATPSQAAEKVREASYKQGERMVLLEEVGEWFKLRGKDGFEGFMKKDYLVTAAEFDFFKGMIGNTSDEKAVIFFDNHPTRFKKALLDFYKKNEWKSAIDTKTEKKIYGNLDFEREIRQVFTKDNQASTNTMIATDLNGNGKNDFVCLLRGQENEELFVQLYNKNNQPTEAFSYTIEGIGHSFKILIESMEFRAWFLGDYDNGEKVYDILNDNSILLNIDGCDILFHLKDSFLEKSEQDCE
ncbi:MAG: SH3 domain-containing protein [Saprospiraceae bacterium]